MFIPIYDFNRHEHVRRQYVTIAIILACTLLFVLFQSGLVFNAGQASAIDLGVIPSVLLEEKVLPAGFGLVPEPLTLFTYVFVHGDWMHLVGNMLFIWVFGDNVEDAMGHLRFALFFFLCAAAGAGAHVLVAPHSDAPLIGASGAASGIIAAYLMLHPKIRLWVLVLNKIPLPLSAAWALGAWIGLQILNALVSDGDNVAWWAHIGGLMAGALLVVVLRRPGVILFDRNAT